MKTRVSHYLTLAWLITSYLGLSGCKPTPEESLEVAVTGLYSADFSSDGKSLVVGSIYHGGSFWSGDERRYNWNHKSDEMTVVVASAFSPDGQWAMTGAARSVVLWSTRTGQSAAFLSTPADVVDIALGTNGTYALVGTTNSEALLYSPNQDSVVRTLPHNNSVASVAISDNGRLAVTGSEDATATLWDLQTGRPLKQIKHEEEVQTVALSPDGRIALSAAQFDKALLWKTDSGKVLGELPLNAEHLKRGKRFTAARFSKKGDQLLTGTADQEVQLWDVNRFQLLAQWRLPKRSAWRPTGAAVLAVSFDKRPGMYHAAASDGFVHQLKR